MQYSGIERVSEQLENFSISGLLVIVNMPTQLGVDISIYACG